MMLPRTLLLLMHRLRYAVFFALAVCLVSGCSDDAPEQPQPADVAAVPVITIETEGQKEITSDTEYQKATINISGAENQPNVRLSGRIRGRGNATWLSYPKKPYKIKLSTEYNVLGFPANRDWVLLAEYTDKSLLRTTYMCEVGKALGMDYVVNCQHVELTLNGEYLGAYLLTDQVERGWQRVNVPKGGFIIEKDTYYFMEPLYFTTRDFSLNFTFKHPDASDGDIVKGDANYVFITDFMRVLEEELLRIPADCESYKKHADITSFARWYILEEVLGNWDPNMYYVLPSREGKLTNVPCWDSEWSLGLAQGGNLTNATGWYEPPYKPQSDMEIWSQWAYLQCMFKDPAFVAEVKEQWRLFYPKIPSVVKAVEQRKKQVALIQAKNFDVWPVLDKYVGAGLVALGSWEAECNYAMNFFFKRVAWMDAKWRSEE